MNKAIEVKGLKKSYGRVEAVKGIDFYAEEGKLFAFLGPNGAGKSTTIDIVCTFLKPDEGEVIVDGLDVYKRQVLATGAHPRELGLKEEKELVGRGVAYCATCDGMRYKGKTVVVTGGGNSAVADALYLAKICKKVYLVHRRDTLRASKVYTEPLKKSGVEMVWNSRVEEILHEKKVTGVRLADVNTGEERTIECEALFVAIGRKPDTEMCIRDRYNYDIKIRAVKYELRQRKFQGTNQDIMYRRACIPGQFCKDNR